ncbi:MAG: hypothetical protein ACLFUL_13580 [Desulfobacteraceae bacterium]
MNGRKAQIGFSQRIRLEWFEQAANLVLAGNDKKTINDSLQELLQDKVSIGGQAMRGNREKIISILMKTWVTVPRGLKTLRDEGLLLHQELPRKSRIAVHWSMVSAVYPFWGAVAAHTGRLLRLQETAAAAHVQRRVREQYGERETVSRAARRVLRSFIDWGVLKETQEKGVYAQGKQYAIEKQRVIGWMVEAVLHARGNSPAALRDILEAPSLFPFRMGYISAENLASLSPRIDILRHGLDQDLVMLKANSSKRAR